MSPYSWVKNNPLGMIDPDGMDAVTYYGKEAVEYIQDLQNKAIASEQNSETQSSKISFSKGFASYRNRQKSEGADPAQNAGCPPGVDCDDVDGTAKDGLLVNTVGNLESGYSIWESNYDHAKVPLVYSRSVKSVGLGLSALNVAIGGAQIYNQRINGEPIDPINAAQVGVGTIGLGASLLNYLGLAGRAMAPISATAGMFGMILSIPSNWAMVYKGAYDLQYVSTPYYPSDSEIFGGD